MVSLAWLKPLKEVLAAANNLRKLALAKISKQLKLSHGWALVS